MAEDKAGNCCMRWAILKIRFRLHKCPVRRAMVKQNTFSWRGRAESRVWGRTGNQSLQGTAVTATLSAAR